MKWCFLVNNANFLSEFLGKIAHQALKEGDSCIVVFNSKMAEYEKKRFFPEKAAFFSKIDWCIANYDPAKKEFGDFSWRDFLPIFDRFTYFTFDYKKSVEAVSQLHQFFQWIIQTERPDAFLGEPPAGLFSEVAYYFAKKHRIPFCGFVTSRIEGRLEIFDSEYTDSRFQKTFLKLKEGDISKDENELSARWLKGFLSHKMLPSYTALGKMSFSQIQLFWHYSKRIREMGSIFLAYLWGRRKFKKYDYESEAVFWQGIFAPFEAEVRQLRIFFQKRLFSPVHERDSFFLYPLHTQPEASTLVLARYYYNQLYTIHNIAFSLPFPYKLYVKEHPVVIKTKPGSFYLALKRIPNVVLISPRENTQKLIQKAAGVITLTGTVGMEAVLAGKPTYVLGKVSYDFHPGCTKVKNFDELEEHIRLDMRKPKELSKLNSINARFAVSYFRNTVPGNIALASSKHDTNDYKLVYLQLKEGIAQ
ncbi:MAG: hypothetical protein Q7R55_00500 [Candidatus Wildermuthbacteria bacterium]|nr:hypothetical protein [Candidatus Wildermuthbacteria bacterium]